MGRVTRVDVVKEIFRAYILVDYVNPLAESSKVGESGYARGPSIVIFPVVQKAGEGPRNEERVKERVKGGRIRPCKVRVISAISGIRSSQMPPDYRISGNHYQSSIYPNPTCSLVSQLHKDNDISSYIVHTT